MNITLYGAASDRIDPAYVDGVEALGRAIAKRGHTMVFGAGSTGLMGAAARGVAAEKGQLIGVTPHFMHTLEPISDLCTAPQIPGKGFALFKLNIQYKLRFLRWLR